MCIYNDNVKKQCVRLDEDIKTYNSNISCYGSVNRFKLLNIIINTANVEIILQRSHVISIPKNITSCAHAFIINISMISFSAVHWDVAIFLSEI